MSLGNTDFPAEIIGEKFKKARSVFFIGIGGVSMSSLAHYCILQGKRVFGYDAVRGECSASLEGKACIKYCSTPDSIDGMDMAVYTTAIDDDCFEYKRAIHSGIFLVSRANFLGYILSSYKNTIAVCGTHGKSTTTAILYHLMKNRNGVSVLCGAKIKENNSYFEFCGDECLIFEACEYKDAFLMTKSDEVLITNIELDHPDYFKNEDMLLSSFKEFCKSARRVYINNDDRLSREIKHYDRVTYSLKDESADYFGKRAVNEGLCELEVYKNGGKIATLPLPFLGEHFAYDALGAFCVAYERGASHSEAAIQLSSFKGIGRRMDYFKKTATGTNIYEDYAHHPTEIRATLLTLKEMGYKNILCIFQPHTYARTITFENEFVSSLKLAQHVIICPTFTARSEGVRYSECDLALRCGGEFIYSLESVANIVSNGRYDCAVIMGAGNIFKLKELI